jgi:hypothetical protein
MVKVGDIPLRKTKLAWCALCQKTHTRFAPIKLIVPVKKPKK